MTEGLKLNPSVTFIDAYWSASNGTAQEVADGLNPTITAPAVPTRFNSNRNEWELMPDDQLPVDVDFASEWKTFTPKNN